ncbi:PIN domain-containing protein [Candidatus Roizmanbacteria bacterium]|nr:PIN domain-containing protein [Candidatus Roizmanbacteria bacterium]
MIFVDTNYFLRYLLDDGSMQHKKATDLFVDGSKGEKKLLTSVLVIFEVMWVLGSTYKISKNEKIDIIQRILDMTFLKLEERDLLYKALEIYRQVTVEFEDCYNISFALKNKIENFATFDRKIIKLLSSIS